MLKSAIQKACPQSELFAFDSADELLSFAKDNICDIAFLDIEMRGMSGIEVAVRLKDILPKINIIFVTGYTTYTKEAMNMHASGYVNKPVTPEKIKEELKDLRHPIEYDSHEALVKVKCFGNFEVFTREGIPIHFQRSKSKELFAFLIFKGGSSVNIREIGATLFEDSPYDSKQRVYIQKIVSSLMATLKIENIDALINKSFNSISVNKELIDCDYYRFLDGELNLINSYQGEFMAQYSWAEIITGSLSEYLY